MKTRKPRNLAELPKNAVYLGLLTTDVLFENNIRLKEWFHSKLNRDPRWINDSAESGYDSKVREGMAADKGYHYATTRSLYRKYQRDPLISRAFNLPPPSTKKNETL